MDELRAALLRIFDMAVDRPDIRGVARAALAASATDEGLERCAICGKPLGSGHKHGGVRVNPRPSGPPPPPPPLPPK